MAIQAAKYIAHAVLGLPDQSIAVSKYSIHALLDPNNSIPTTKLIAHVVLGPEEVEQPPEEEPTDPTETTFDVPLARYRVTLNTEFQDLLLSDRRGHSRFYQNGEVFFAEEYFDRYTEGENAILEKLGDSAEGGEFVAIEIPANTRVAVTMHRKLWNFINPTEGQIFIELGGKQFRVDAGESPLFPIRGDFVVSHALDTTVVINFWVV